MSRSLVSAALGVFVLAGLLPLAVMASRVGSDDLAAVFTARTASLLGRTLALGGGTALGALLLGLPFGFLVARTDLPGASLWRTLGVVPLLLPPLLIAMTWAVLWPGLRGAAGTVFLLSLSTYPLVAIFTARAFERIDAASEEAALLAGGLGAVVRMELPLVLPAALTGATFAFAFAINDFGVPDYVSSVGPKFNVYADEIKLQWDQVGRTGAAVASSIPLVLVTFAALLLALRLRRRGAMGSMGTGFRTPAPLALGRWRWPALAFVLAVLGAALVVPIARLVWEAGAMDRQLGERDGLAALGAGFSTLRHEFGVALELARADLARSILYSAGAALVCVPVGLVLGHALERTRARASRLLEACVILPIAVPALLFGIGEIATWNHAATARFYDGGAMATWLFIGRFSPFAILVLSGAVAALPAAGEEAAALAGAGPIRRLLFVVAPSLGGSLAASFVLVFVFAMRDLDSAILVPAANKTAIFRVFNGVHFGRDSYVAALSLLLVIAILLPGTLWALFARKRLEVLP
ncbi:MAG TPA: iron ABC transporter permease [Planctomycetes bacterium]|nr:iron ABC transporter permease [Planctomycetota bacterium]